MLKIILPSLGLLGGIIGLFAYWPQISKLIKVRRSDQLSILTWAAWVFANLLLLVYAISIKDFVYIILESLHTFFLLLIFILIIVYKKDKNKL